MARAPDDKYRDELGFLDSLSKDSPTESPEQVAGPAEAVPTQSYDAVGSLFSYLTSGVRTVTSTSVATASGASTMAQNVVSNVASVQNITAGAQYLRQATSTLIGAQGHELDQLDGAMVSSKNEAAEPLNFSHFDQPPGWQGHG